MHNKNNSMTTYFIRTHCYPYNRQDEKENNSACIYTVKYNILLSLSIFFSCTRDKTVLWMKVKLQFAVIYRCVVCAVCAPNIVTLFVVRSITDKKKVYIIILSNIQGWKKNWVNFLSNESETTRLTLYIRFFQK